MYELEDIAWEEFGDNDDLIKDEYGVGSDCSKRPRYELSYGESNGGRKSGSNNIVQKDDTGSSAVKEEKEIMLEKGPQSHSSSGTSASLDGDSNIRTSCSTSDEGKTSNPYMKNSNMDSFGGELCAADPVLDDQAAAVDNNLFRYQQNNASNNENDLGLFSNNLRDQESSDLLYYGWPEIENFEDVDRMFRSSDSTFGLEIDKDDEFGWFSAAHGIEESDDALRLSFNFSGCDSGAINGVSEHQESYSLNGTGLAANEADIKPIPASLKKGSRKSPNGSPAIKNYSYDNGSGAVPHTDNGSQIQSHVSQAKEQRPSEEKRQERPTENPDYFIHLDNLKPVGESNHSLKPQYNFRAETHKRQETRHQTCSQTPISLLSANHNHNLARPRSSRIKSEDSGFPSISPRESSNGSHQMQSMESSPDVSFKNPAVPRIKKKDRSDQHRLSSHLEKRQPMVKTADSDSVSARKPVPSFENEFEGESDVNGSDMGIQGELDSSNMQESSCLSSVLDEISIEASSFRQLQHVMGQLDIRTKLCIRDSLYRLARSAEQRHKCVKHSVAGKDDKDASGAVTSDGTDESTGFVDMETDTNPIDRSIAHLLFHRPSDPSATALVDAFSAKSYTMVQAAKNGPVAAEKLICQDTTSPNDEATE